MSILRIIHVDEGIRIKNIDDVFDGQWLQLWLYAVGYGDFYPVSTAVFLMSWNQNT